MNDNLQGQVQRAIDELVASGAEIGLQVAVYHQGELVVDAVAGAADRDTGRPVTSDTLFYAASTGKAATATVANVLVDRGVPRVRRTDRGPLAGVRGARQGEG